MLKLFLIIVFAACLLLAAFAVIRWLYFRERTLARWERSADIDVTEAIDSGSPRGWLSGWLYLAGYRSPFAVGGFVAAMIQGATQTMGKNVSPTPPGTKTTVRSMKACKPE